MEKKTYTLTFEANEFEFKFIRGTVAQTIDDLGEDSRAGQLVMKLYEAFCKAEEDKK